MSEPNAEAVNHPDHNAEPNSFAFAEVALSMLLAELDRVWAILGEEISASHCVNPVAEKVRFAMKGIGLTERVLAAECTAEPIAQRGQE